MWWIESSIHLTHPSAIHTHTSIKCGISCVCMLCYVYIFYSIFICSIPEILVRSSRFHLWICERCCHVWWAYVWRDTPWYSDVRCYWLVQCPFRWNVTLECICQSDSLHLVRWFANACRTALMMPPSFPNFLAEKCRSQCWWHNQSVDRSVSQSNSIERVRERETENVVWIDFQAVFVTVISISQFVLLSSRTAMILFFSLTLFYIYIFWLFISLWLPSISWVPLFC